MILFKRRGRSPWLNMYIFQNTIVHGRCGSGVKRVPLGCTRFWLYQGNLSDIQSGASPPNSCVTKALPAQVRRPQTPSGIDYLWCQRGSDCQWWYHVEDNISYCKLHLVACPGTKRLDVNSQFRKPYPSKPACGETERDGRTPRQRGNNPTKTVARGETRRESKTAKALSAI